MPISEESIFPLDSSSLTLGGLEQSHHILAPSPISRYKAAERKATSRRNASRRSRRFDSIDFKLHARRLGAHGPRLMKFYGGNTLEARNRTLRKLEEYRELYNQSPITPIGRQGPRGGESHLQWKCNICGEDFATFQKVAVHLTSREWGLANWKCPETSCVRVYQSRNELIRHKKAAHSLARPDEYEDTIAETLIGTADSSSPLHPTSPLQPAPLAQITGQPLVMPQHPVSLRQTSTSFAPQTPPTWMDGQHIEAPPPLPHSHCPSFDCWSSRQVETFQRYLLNTFEEDSTPVGAVAALPPMKGQVAYQPPLVTPHRTQTMPSDRRLIRLGNGAFDTSSNTVEPSVLFRTALSPTDETIDPYRGPQFPITSFYSQSDLMNPQGPHWLSSESPPPFPTPTPSVSYFISPLLRSPATELQYFAQDGRTRQVQIPDEDTDAVDSKVPLTEIDNTDHIGWLHHDSELKWLALYQLDDATARLASNSAKVPTGEWLPPMTGGGKYTLEKLYEMDTI